MSSGSTAPRWASDCLKEIHGFQTIIVVMAGGNPMEVRRISEGCGFVEIAQVWRHIKAREPGTGFKALDSPKR